MMNPFRLRRSSTKRTTIPRPLKSGQTYRLWLVTSRTPPYGQKEELAIFKTNLAGAQVAQAVGPFRQVLTSESEKTAELAQKRFLLLTLAESDAAELIEKAPEP
jgi:hypothetical protein